MLCSSLLSFGEGFSPKEVISSGRVEERWHVTRPAARCTHARPTANERRRLPPPHHKGVTARAAAAAAWFTCWLTVYKVARVLFHSAFFCLFVCVGGGGLSTPVGVFGFPRSKTLQYYEGGLDCCSLWSGWWCVGVAERLRLADPFEVASLHNRVKRRISNTRPVGGAGVGGTGGDESRGQLGVLGAC